MDSLGIDLENFLRNKIRRLAYSYGSGDYIINCMISINLVCSDYAK